MSARLTELEYAEILSRRSGGLRIPAPPPAKQTISREVKHDYKAEFEQQLSLVGIQVEREFVILPNRKWRSDWRVKATNVLIEFEGGLFAKNKIGHGNVGGILRDIEKYNACAIAGWLVIRITPKHVMSGEALKWVEDALRTIGASR